MHHHSEVDNLLRGRMNIIIEAPAEFDPVELLFLAQNKHGIRRADFAVALGVEFNTLEKWAARIRNPSKPWRIRAAELREKWNL